MARLAELTLLCAGHYADCGEVTAAGDLLVNPRRTDIDMQGVVQSIRKDRHRRLSEQLDPGGLSPAEHMDWLKRNTTVKVTEPPLLTDFLFRLMQSGSIEEEFLNAFEDRMNVVADTMRFSCIASQIIQASDEVDRRHRPFVKDRSMHDPQCHSNRAWFIELG